MPVKFRKVLISAETFESAGAWDVDGDGVLDIVSGAFWYQGPDFFKRRQIGNHPVRYGEYYDDFSTIPLDIDGDEKIDFITGGWWGNSLRWRQCPQDLAHEWPEHILATDVGNVETTRAWDIDGDGEIEIVPNTPNNPLVAFKLLRDAAGKGTGKFSKHTLFDKPIGHGYGFGDIDGDGQGEFVFIKGILKATGTPLTDKWEHLPEFDLGHWDASCPMLVVDVNGDGLADIIVGHAHSYGLYWLQQKRDANGKRSWTKHQIDPFVAQYHDLQWADIDGDGKPELITGKRYRAHCGNEAGEADDLGIFYFKWTGDGFAKQVIDYGPHGVGAGCGIHFWLADLRKTGRLDIIAPGKDGLHVFFNEGS